MSEINIPERHDYKTITPFRLFVKSNFPFIESTYEALDNYGLYCKVVEYLNQVIDEQNKVNADMVTFTDFVTNYFENLDVQEEINNKLDEMVTTGELQNLVNDIFKNLENKIDAVAGGSPAGTYPTYNDLVNDTNADTNKIYLVLSNGEWYYYNTSNNTWTSGGVYQSTQLETDKTLQVENKASDGAFTGDNIRTIASLFTNKFDKNNFVNGSIDNQGNIDATYIYRIVSHAIVFSPVSLKIKIPTGYRCGINTYTDKNVFIAWQGWKTSGYLTIPAYTYFRLVIAKISEDTANILSISDTIPLFEVINENQEIENKNNIEYQTYFLNSILKSTVVNGAINDAGGVTNVQQRISTKEIMKFNCDINIIIPNLFRIGVHTYNDNGTLLSDLGWQYGYYKIPKNTNFRFMIARYIEDSSEVLDIDSTIEQFKILRNEEFNMFLDNSIDNELKTNKIDTTFVITGNYNDNGAFVQQVFRNVSTMIRHYPVDIKIQIPNNYRIGIHYFDSNGNWLSWGGWFTGEILITSDKYFKLLYAKAPDVTGQILLPEETIPLYSIYDNKNNNYQINEQVTVEITSRQGEVNGYPENTLQGFEESKRAGYNHVRVSFGWTSDGVAVCLHDLYAYQSKLRNTDGTAITDQTLRFDQMTYAQIEIYDAGIYKGSEFAGITVPTLESVLKQCKKLNQAVDIEFKFGYSESRLLSLLQLIYTIGLQDNCLYSTGHIPSLQYIQNSAYNKIKTGYIANFTSENIQTCITNNFNRIDMFDTDTYDANLALLAHQNDIKIKIGSVYNLTQAIDAFEKYDVIECANIINPLFNI